MGYAKTRLVIITSTLPNLDETLEIFADLNCFHPVKFEAFVDLVHGLKSLSEDNPCPSILSELEDIEKENGLEIEAVATKTASHQAAELEKDISAIHQKLKEFAKAKGEKLDQKHKYEEARVQMQNLEGLEVAIDDIFACEYVYARVGRLPMESLDKLDFYQSRPFLFNSFSVDRNYSWCMYFTSQEFEREVDNIFSSLFFERIRVPDFIHGTPKEALVTLSKEIADLDAELDRIAKERQAFIEENLDSLKHAKGELTLLKRIYDAKEYVVGMGDKFAITGFIRAKHVKIVHNHFREHQEIEVSILPADSDKRLTPPIKLKDDQAF